MKILIEDIENAPESMLDVDFCEIIDDLGNGKEVRGKLEIKSNGATIEVKGHINTTMKLVCDRCLSEFDYDVDADIYIMVDGDDTYPAESVHQLIETIVEGRADMAIGDRLSNGTYQKENKRFFHKFGNNLVKKGINVLFNTHLKDIMTGYRAFSKTFVKNMPVLSPNFELETEMTLFALDKKFRLKEIPIVFRERPDGSESKINTFSDGIKVIKTIIKMFKDHKPLKFFTIIFAILLIIGIIIGLPVIIEFCKTGYITKMPSAVLATGIITLAVICEQCGIILHTIVKQHRENYELNLLRYTQIENKNNK